MGWGSGQRSWKTSGRMSEQKQRGTRRFWVRPGEKGKIVGLDRDPLFEAPEHQLRLKNVSGDFERMEKTCLSALGQGCPLCDIGDEPTWVRYATVIELWKADDDQLRAIKKLWVLKKRAFEALAGLVEKRGGILRGWVIEVSRTSEKSASSGDTFDFEKQIPDGELVGKFKPLLGWLDDPKFNSGPVKMTAEKYLAPYDYATLLKPETAEQLLRLARRLTGTGAQGTYTAQPDSDGAPPPNDSPLPVDDDSIPF